MRTNRSPKDPVRRLKGAMQALGRVFCLRDPLAAAVGGELSRPQLHAILALGCEPLSMGELGHWLGATGPTVTGLVDRLERLGMVERRRSTADRRIVTLHLTRKGAAVHQRFEAALDERLGELLGLLDPPDRRALVDIFERLAARVAGAAAGERCSPARGAPHAQA